VAYRGPRIPGESDGMTTARIGVAATAVLVASVALLLGGALREPSPAVPSSPPGRPGGGAEALRAGFSPGDTPGVVRRLQAAVRATPGDAGALGLLGLAYQQRARETGDPTYYTKSEGVLRRALALDPADRFATSGLGSLALARHDFREALALGRRARAISPRTARDYGVVGDALAELGRYREAFRAFERMGELRPGLAAYARIAHARWLLGRTDQAIGAMRLALHAATGQPEPEAWTRVQLGKLLFSRGAVRAADAQYRAALAVFPGYAPALDARALAAWAWGRTRAAIALEQRAVDAIPLPQYVAQLGDLYRAAGDARRAREQYALIGAIERLLAANGVRTELESALFDADRGARPRQTLALARRARRARPSIEGDDVLAWALARAGRCGEAVRYSRRALRLGTRDALMLFHRGMAERCLGHDSAGRSWFRRALALNPHFSVRWAPVARRLA
jgi:tetratricopeptide (TPR) repeat protein